MLNIERDPLAQGFESGQFDIVVAANVIHATEDLHTTLGNIYTLLAPGGRLIVLEGTRPTRWLDLTFGLTDGWWRFSDTHLRPDYPLLSAQNWSRLLAETGFAASRIVTPLPTAVGQREPENSVIVCQRNDSADHASGDDVVADESTNWLILTDAAGIGDSLAEQLRTRGTPCKVIHAPRPSDRGDLLSDVVSSDELATDVAFLWSLNDTDGSTSPPELARLLNESLLNTVQLVAQRHSQRVSGNGHHNRPIRFWVVTRGAQGGSDGREQSVAQASLWGFVRTLALEHPDWQSHLIDLDPAVDIRSAAATLVDEVTRDAGEQENEIVFRNGLRLVRRMQKGLTHESPSPGEQAVMLTDPYSRHTRRS